MKQLDLFTAAPSLPSPEDIKVRHAKSPYGYRASIDLPGTRGALHCNERYLFQAIAAVRRKYANWLAVSQEMSF